MSDSPETPWSDDPNAPQVPYWLHLAEGGDFAGLFIGMILYGIVIALFFRCMGALLGPDDRPRRGMKLALVAHTVTMFLLLTIPIATGLNDYPTCYINYREFPGIKGTPPDNNEIPPGPFGYSLSHDVESKAISLVHVFMFSLNQWLADGLLLHRCYVIYSANYRFMAFPCLMYLASVATGIAYIWVGSGPEGDTLLSAKFGTSYYSTCLSLNILLTLMIVVRLVMHIWNIRKTLGASDGSRGLYTAAATAATMLIESYALYAVALILFIVPWGLNSWVLIIFSGSVGQIQVIAPYLIILRVANRRALTSDNISGTLESIRFGSQGSTDGDEISPDRDPEDPTEVNGEAPGEPSAGEKNGIEEVPL